MAQEFGDEALDELYDDDTGELKKPLPYVPIRPEGPITGAIFENGYWVHVGQKRKKFDDWDASGRPNSHTNLLANPTKKRRFLMKVEQSEIEILTKDVKQNKPPRHVNPIALLQASELKNKHERHQSRLNRTKSSSKNSNNSNNSKNPNNNNNNNNNNNSSSSSSSSSTSDFEEDFVANPDEANKYDKQLDDVKNGDDTSKNGIDEAYDILSMAGRFKVPEKFEDLPISQMSKWTLGQKKFLYLTDIQKAAIPHALVGRDVLGAAKTGSGKTLAFVIPLIENLYRKAWNSTLGLGALVLAPTRELALQIFKTIRMVGRRMRHLSCGLVIGGRHSRMEEERNVIGQMCIIVGTPGRVLKHFEKSSGNFHCNSLQMLVIDEADEMLEIGLLEQVQKILQYLPKKKQTLLFSATLTTRIIRLAKISLRRPVYLPVDNVDSALNPLASSSSQSSSGAAGGSGGSGASGDAGNGAAGNALPSQLMQTYIETPVEHKYDLLWSFLQTHIDHKIIVFFATLRQVKFTHRMFLKLRPYSSVIPLHSELSQTKRITMYDKFKRSKTRSILLATEIAARGLDFPNVDWVVNFDVPSNVTSYIHRVGRSARLGQRGNCITFLLSEELKFVGLLQEAGIVVKKLGIHTKNLRPILGSFRTELARNQEMSELAVKAFKSYLAFYYFHSNSDYMDAKSLDKDKVAYMFGLMHRPQYKKFLKGVKVHRLGQMPSELKNLLLDTKQKRKEKNEMKKKQKLEWTKHIEKQIKREEQEMEAKDGKEMDDAEQMKSAKKVSAEDENDGAPEWWTETFKDRKDENVEKSKDQKQKKTKEEEEEDEDIKNFMDDDDDDSEEDDDEEEDFDVLQDSAMQAILARDAF